MEPLQSVQHRRDGFELVVQALKDASGLDLNAYKERQTLRRLSGFLSRHDIADWAELAARIRIDGSLRQQLTDHLAINVSEFFRNPERFQHLADEVLPELMARYSSLRIWSAGSSVGAEAYSLAIMLDEAGAGAMSGHRRQDRVLATDIDREALAKARGATFGDDWLKEVSAERRQRFFEPSSDGRWRVRAPIRSYVSFLEHNLLVDPYPQHQHLILCRNVIIYFTEEAKNDIIRRFAESLAPGGYLLVGSTETIFRSDQYRLRSVAPFLYTRMED